MVVVAAVSLSLAACGDSDGGSASVDGSASDGQASETPAADDTDAVAESNDGDPSDEGHGATSSGPRNPPGPSGGPAFDPDWPEEVWFPADLELSTGAINVMGEGAYIAVLGGRIDMGFEEVRDALIAANGAPDEALDHPTGTHIMSYFDLVSASDVTFELGEDADGTILLIRMLLN